MIWIGIDPGEHTGFAVWDSKKKSFLDVRTLRLHQALNAVITRHLDEDVTVVFEDARQRKYLPREKSVSEYRGKLMGAGSICRDCTIWEETLKDYGIKYFAKPPRKGMTKMDEDYFKTLTGWTGRTSNHARDAAMLVLGR